MFVLGPLSCVGDQVGFLQGFGEEVTLQQVEAIGAHTVEHVFGLDAFRYGIEAEPECELSYGTHDGIVGRRSERAHDEALIDLDDYTAMLIAKRK